MSAARADGGATSAAPADGEAPADVVGATLGPGSLADVEAIDLLSSFVERLEPVERRIVQLEIERQALQKESDGSAVERRGAIESELAELREKSQGMKASWQADVDRGQQTVRDAFPNGFNDWIPEELMDPELARVFYPGLAAGNPLSAAGKTSPVEELIAEGFGTLTHQAEQRATGRHAPP